MEIKPGHNLTTFLHIGTHSRNIASTWSMLECSGASMKVRPAIHYQVDLTGTAEKVHLSQVYLIPDEHTHTHYEVDLTGTPDQVYLIPDEGTHTIRKT
jgi:hypothetical protein